VHERRGIRRAVWIAACVIAALLVVGWALPSVRGSDEFAVIGEIDGLYPGSEATLDARITNTEAFPIRVLLTRVTVRDANAMCPASMLVFGNSDATVEIPPDATVTLPMTVRLGLAASDACQGATWPLQFTGTAIGLAVTGPPDMSMVVALSLAALVAIGTLLALAGLFATDDRGRRRPRAT
jgi:hypothetical protein